MTTKIGCAYDPETKLGPVVSAKHKKSICDWIQKGLDEGAELVCQFCCKKYYFDKEHLQRILAEMKKKKDDIAD